ncbi:ORF6N domain-containing protein [Flavobacterium ardleyense]|uniref:ORF6N domain-containing protein n=1 Tax=Flavobacterium ardleyense TaxID=2038737 RepID=A0ABW5ZCH1_9FLAO
MQTLEIIHNKIHVIRDQKVMLDFDLAALYEIETRVLKQAVRRNIERFPEDFMFILTKEEHANLRSQIVTSSYGGTRYAPFAFTEQGVAMLSSVLNSKKAIEVNIAIMRTFVVLRNSILSLEEISKRISEVEKKFPDIYNALNFLMENNQEETEQKQRSPIGFQKK